MHPEENGTGVSAYYSFTDISFIKRVRSLCISNILLRREIEGGSIIVDYVHNRIEKPQRGRLRRKFQQGN